VDDLIAAGCAQIFTDKASGKLASRPELDACLAQLVGAPARLSWSGPVVPRRRAVGPCRLPGWPATLEQGVSGHD
jgi:hypothetical protein